MIDVKVGSGGLAGPIDAATALAQSRQTVAAASGLRTVALLTDMNQALGATVGNALEVREAIDLLTGRCRDARRHAVTAALAAELLVLGQLQRDAAAAAATVQQTLASGAAAERFARMVTALDGPADLVERPDRYLAAAPVRRPVAAARSGVVAGVDTRALGLLLIQLGGGRRRADDAIDPAVGLAEVCGVGDAVGRDRPLAVIHAGSAADADAAAAVVRQALAVVDGPAPVPRSPLLGRIVSAA